jgi:hypothetical protein
MMQAIARILETDPHPHLPLTICTDSEYTINGPSSPVLLNIHTHSVHSILTVDPRVETRRMEERRRRASQEHRSHPLRPRPHQRTTPHFDCCQHHILQSQGARGDRGERDGGSTRKSRSRAACGARQGLLARCGRPSSTIRHIHYHTYYHSRMGGRRLVDRGGIKTTRGFPEL